MDKKSLIQLAVNAQQDAIAPYSHFYVGAALLCRDGRVFTGCNIESAAFSPTVCAERTALVKALSEGARDFVALAVVGGKNKRPGDTATSPCGVCRQMLYEFCGRDLQVIMAYGAGYAKLAEATLGALLPMGFAPEKIL